MDIHELDTAEEILEFDGTSHDLLSSADVGLRRRVIQSPAFLLTFSHRCAAQPS